VSERPIVREYAEFRAVCDKQKTAWRAWETGKKKSTAGKDYDPECRDFYLYIQWVAQEQINDLISNFNQNGLRFYLDLPLGVNPDSFDAFFYRGYFADGASAGAPPDSFFTKGQDWGFAPLHPEKIREHHYRYLIDYLDFQMRHTGMLRIDHVMGLHRLYWVPHGFPASSGAYVRYRSEELYAILSVESHRHKAMLVGENLGTVPPEVNQSMARHGLRRMYVLQYEQQPSGSLRPPDHPVAASMNSHDMPTFAAHWEGEDITDRARLGLLTKAQVREETKNRARLRKNLVQFLRSEKLLKTARPSVEEIYSAAIQFLSSSPAETVLVNLEDLWGEKKPQNTPGTSTERVNWRRKSALTIEQIGSLSTQDAAVRDLLEQLASRLSKG